LYGLESSVQRAGVNSEVRWDSGIDGIGGVFAKSTFWGISGRCDRLRGSRGICFNGP
jgi:hypothetical protein